MKLSELTPDDPARDARETQRLRDGVAANERALRAQQASRLVQHGYRQRIDFLVRKAGLTDQEAINWLANYERYEAATKLATEVEHAQRAALAEQEAALIGASPWLASGSVSSARTEVKSAPIAISLAPSPPTATGRFTGLAAVFGGPPDSYGDIIEPGAFTRTIAAAKARGKPYLFPLLYQHDTTKVIGGIATAVERAAGLWVECQLEVNTREGSEAYSLLRNGFLDGMSIGYLVVTEQHVGNVRHLTELTLLEASLVTFPANPAAHVTGTS